MEETVLSIPLLWADHHVLAVRDALLSVEGVRQVEASALHHSATVAYDPAKTAPEGIVAALREAGYAVGDETTDGGAAGETPAAGEPRSWAGNGSRVTATNPVDLAMSGDYRKY